MQCFVLLPFNLYNGLLALRHCLLHELLALMNKGSRLLSVHVSGLSNFGVLFGQLGSNFKANSLSAGKYLFCFVALAFGEVYLPLIVKTLYFCPGLVLQLNLFSYQLNFGLLGVPDHLFQRRQPCVGSLLRLDVLCGKCLDGGPRFVPDFNQYLGITSVTVGLLAVLTKM